MCSTLRSTIESRPAEETPGATVAVERSRRPLSTQLSARAPPAPAAPRASAVASVGQSVEVVVPLSSSTASLTASAVAPSLPLPPTTFEASSLPLDSSSAATYAKTRLRGSAASVLLPCEPGKSALLVEPATKTQAFPLSPSRPSASADTVSSALPGSSASQPSPQPWPSMSQP